MKNIFLATGAVLGYLIFRKMFRHNSRDPYALYDVTVQYAEASSSRSIPHPFAFRRYPRTRPN